MRDEQEIRSALRDLQSTKHMMRRDDNSAQLSEMVRDTLAWVLGFPSTMDQAVPKLRAILAAKEGAVKN